ncbi:efflux RND transporter periplasmic adaptor subunit [Marinobacterium weihaiense]|uniref:Efflux RND transporter periplasmic adaptor subunit n=1 Tax=Marinobacterium weihaiense TaxID=2851016 RepID=A0ABS6M9D9_9GAMM|nr:efflux RND transporter periplasmic adaptor subunit [Marinobacterium weihaiense]MBV0932911.1 efflux RND transporter periplasmic adaptor subunit [Marinobacterium weihaiense]
MFRTLQKSPRHLYLALTGVLLSMLLTGCDSEPPAAASSVTDVERPARIERVRSVESDSLVFNGTVRAAQRAELAFKVAGRVEKMVVNEGDRVEAGDLLAQLDDRELRTALSSARAEYASADADYKRGLAIYKRSQAISKSDLEKLATQQNLAANRLREAQLALDETRLTAPFAGVVGRKLVEDFARVGANQTVVVLQNLQDLEVVIQVPDKVVLQHHREQPVAARIVGLEQQFPLSLKFFATEADPVTQTYQVVFGLGDKGDAPVLPGMSAQVFAVGSNGEQRVAVPLSAIVPDNQGQQFVWRVSDEGRAMKQPVQVGPLLGDRAVITDGLAQGERIITAGVGSVREGMAVRPLDNKE